MDQQHGNVESASPLAGVFGTGRSGSTWVGAILNSHPDVVYRFEPFHRLRSDPSAAKLRARLEAPDCGCSDLEDAYRWLLRAHPALEKPPMFWKRCVRNLGRRRLWPLARAAAPARWLFEHLYTPTGRPFVVFKEVTMEPLMARLLERTTVPAVYLVRHPCGVVASTVRGQSHGLMSSGRLSVLKSLLENHDSELARRYAPRLDSMSTYALNGLLWRIDVERGVDAVLRSTRGMLVVYERLCRETHDSAVDLFSHFGLSLAAETQRFLELSSRPDPGHRRRFGEGWIDGYFSVFRDPLESMDRWKEQMDRRSIEEVLEVVRDSPAFERCAELGAWSV